MTASVLTAAAGQTAVAAPKPDIATVRKQVEQLQEDAGAAAEKYNAAVEQLKTVTVQAKAAKARVGQQTKQVEAGRRLLGQLAVEQYKIGDLSVLDTLLSDKPQDTLAAMGLASNLTDRKAQAVASLLTAQKQLATDEATLAKRQTALATQTNQLASARKVVETKLADRKRLLASLSAAQRAQLEAETSNSERNELTGAGVDVPATGNVGCGAVDIASPSGRVSAVIAFACSQLGEPYRWGGSGPSNWDCSGLTSGAWGAAGVSLPHNAQMQSHYGRHVSVSELQPGDLVYFYSYGHVGIYIGHGLMIHAPHTGDVVRISSIGGRRVIDATRPG